MKKSAIAPMTTRTTMISTDPPLWRGPVTLGRPRLEARLAVVNGYRRGRRSRCRLAASVELERRRPSPTQPHAGVEIPTRVERRVGEKSGHHGDVRAAIERLQ